MGVFGNINAHNLVNYFTFY